MGRTAVTSRPRPRWKVGERAAAALAVLAFAVTPFAAHADGIPVVRDAEAESLLYDYLRPILKTAGVSPAPHIHIVQSDQFNAFVTGRNDLFVNTETIIESKTPDELIGILAHETGHIAGGHLARMREELARAQTTAIVAMLRSRFESCGRSQTSPYNRSCDNSTR